MAFDSDGIRQQLKPGWSVVNIVIMIFAFWLFWPLGLLMIAYILKGADYGLDLGRPASFRPMINNISDTVRGWLGSSAPQTGSGRVTTTRSTGEAAPGGTPSAERHAFEDWRRSEQEKLRAEREALERERAAFEAEKRRSESSTDA